MVDTKKATSVVVDPAKAKDPVKRVVRPKAAMKPKASPPIVTDITKIQGVHVFMTCPVCGGSGQLSGGGNCYGCSGAGVAGAMVSYATWQSYVTAQTNQNP